MIKSLINNYKDVTRQEVDKERNVGGERYRIC
jgi:hypothetical protein